MSRGPRVAEDDVAAVAAALEMFPDGLNRRDLLDAVVRIAGRPVGDSAMRVAIEELRGRGELIVHDGHKYRFAASYEQYARWRVQSPLARAHRLLEQVRRMDDTASRKWPEQLQLIAA